MPSPSTQPQKGHRGMRPFYLPHPDTLTGTITGQYHRSHQMENESLTRLKSLEESVLKINGAMKTFSSEMDAMKNNLQLISEIINKFAAEGGRKPDEGKYRVFGRFVEESLDGMAQEEAEGAVLEIVEVLHKHESR